MRLLGRPLGLASARQEAAAEGMGGLSRVRAATGAMWRRLASLAVGRTALMVLLIFFVAVGVRLLWIFLVNPSPEDGRFDDTAAYHYMAIGLKEGEGYNNPFLGTPTAHWPPGYPATLAALYGVVGESVVGAKVLNAVLGASTCLLLFALGSIVFSRGVGLVAGLVLAFFPNQIYYSTLLLSETLFVFLVVGLLLLTVMWTRRGVGVWWYQAVLLGAFIGLVTYVRGEALLLPLLLTAVWLVVARPRWRALALGGLAFVAAGLMITPWIVRNAIEVGHPVVMSTGSGRNLFAGHWEGADGGGSTAEARARMLEGYEHLDRPEQDVAVYKASFKRAFDFAIHHPLKEITLVGQKLYNLYREDADGVRWVQSTRPEAVELHEERFTVIANGYYFVVVGLALLSAPVWFSLRDPRRLLLIGAILYFSFLFGVIFIGEPRHHLPVIPVVSLLAAAACVRIWEAGRRGRQATAAAPCQAS